MLFRQRLAVYLLCGMTINEVLKNAQLKSALRLVQAGNEIERCKNIVLTKALFDVIDARDEYKERLEKYEEA